MLRSSVGESLRLITMRCSYTRRYTACSNSSDIQVARRRCRSTRTAGGAADWLPRSASAAARPAAERSLEVSARVIVGIREVWQFTRQCFVRAFAKFK